MSTYLCNFVKNGNPNSDDTAKWGKCKTDRDVISFGDAVSSKGRIKTLIYNTLTIKPVGE